MDYMDMLKRGWAVAWDNKYLWILGFLGALGGGNSLFSYSANSGAVDPLDPAAVGTMAAGIAAASCVGIILGIGLWLVSLAARGGLIDSVARIELHKPADGFVPAFRHGWSKVWSLAGLTIILFGAVFLAGLVILLVFGLSGGALAALFGGNEGAQGSLFAGLGILGLCLFGLLCLLIPVFIVLNFVYGYAMRGVVLRDMGAMDAIRHGWQVLRDHLGVTIMLTLAFLIFNLIAWMIGAAILFAFGLGMAIPINLLSNTNATFLQGLLGVLGVLGAAIITAVVSAVIVTWQSSTFTIAYLNFTGKDITFDEA
jgi:hypothetical protein